MSIATVISSAVLGVEARPVTVETHLSNGLPGFAIVGLPQTAVKESKERVRSAIINSGLEFPNRRITVNLAPADLPKSGGRYDLAIALSILLASKQLKAECVADCEILGELALDGAVRLVHGCIPAVLAAQRASRSIVLPLANQQELALTGYEQGYCADNLASLVNHLLLHDTLNGLPNIGLPGSDLAGNGVLGNDPPDNGRSGDVIGSSAKTGDAKPRCDFSRLQQIRGQQAAKRALQLAAAGGHNLLMIGPPGSGKTLLARALPELLPPLSDDEAIEVAAIRSVSKSQQHAACYQHQRPFRAPHHSTTGIALVGGGNRVNPGEVSYAHHGVLFLDELTEFSSGVVDMLREPLESGEITITRANYTVHYPARFQLIAALNPCPCGYASDPQRECKCSPDVISRYLGRISGPLLDRFDMIVEVPALSQAELLKQPTDNVDWLKVRTRIHEARLKQSNRNGALNSQLGIEKLEQVCELPSKLKKQLAATLEQLKLSARSTHRVIKLARTIADYENNALIREKDLMEAVSYRHHQLRG